MTALLIIGDILVCGFFAALAAWLFMRAGDDEMDEAARIPLLEDDDDE